jgi:hypothetical protein
MELGFSIVLSIIGVLAATGLAYFIGAGYRHRSYINQLQKQGFVSFLPFFYYGASILQNFANATSPL